MSTLHRNATIDWIVAAGQVMTECGQGFSRFVRDSLAILSFVAGTAPFEDPEYKAIFAHCGPNRFRQLTEIWQESEPAPGLSFELAPMNGVERMQLEISNRGYQPNPYYLRTYLSELSSFRAMLPIDTPEKQVIAWASLAAFIDGRYDAHTDVFAFLVKNLYAGKAPDKKRQALIDSVFSSAAECVSTVAQHRDDLYLDWLDEMVRLYRQPEPLQAESCVFGL